MFLICQRGIMKSKHIFFKLCADSESEIVLKFLICMVILGNVTLNLQFYRIFITASIVLLSVSTRGGVSPQKVWWTRERSE